eukprot:gene26194-biopygen14790
MLGGSGGVGKFCGFAPHIFSTPPLSPSISPPHLQWVLVQARRKLRRNAAED